MDIYGINKNHKAEYSDIIVQSFNWPDQIAGRKGSSYKNKKIRHYLVVKNGERIAAGALYIRGEYASVSLAGTLPSSRGQGGQGALIQKRLADAKSMGCKWIAVKTAEDTAEKSLRHIKIC